MGPLHRLSSTAVLATALAGCLAHADEQPLLLPSRDVEITYDIAQPPRPKVRERVRWLASEHLERVDGADRSTTIFDRKRDEITLLVPANKTYRKLEGAARAPLPEPGTVFQRGGEAVVAKQPCTEWSWSEDAEERTICVTVDGVLLRLTVDGRTVVEARAVHYGPQPSELFQVPPGYAPALAPEGVPGQ
jgi:hypothetical protein